MVGILLPLIGLPYLFLVMLVSPVPTQGIGSMGFWMAVLSGCGLSIPDWMKAPMKTHQFKLSPGEPKSDSIFPWERRKT